MQEGSSEENIKTSQSFSKQELKIGDLLASFTSSI